MRSILHRLYGPSKGATATARIMTVLESFMQENSPGRAVAFSEKDAVLITYGDTLWREGERSLHTLYRFMEEYVRGMFSGVHILPFFPYSSDDGFSVTDFYAVRPELGTWADVRKFGESYRLMVDLVVNHVSAQSVWFKNYLAGQEGFASLAIAVDPLADTSSVVRPRSHPLLTCFEKHSGEAVHLWTTFSADQIDLNYQSLDVLENMVRVLLFYVSQGASMIRLDAIAYLWKEIGTPSIHLPQTHQMVRLFRWILDRVAPHVALITETNVPHDENIRYFGNGQDEAQLVYNFTLGPLLLFALASGNARTLSEWVQNLSTPTAEAMFFNFTASHDGIGVRPLEGILASAEIERLSDRLRRNGAYVSKRRQMDGTDAAYEFNITYFDALREPDDPEDPLHIARFLASQALTLTLPGIPAVYIHSLFGSRNWSAGVELTERARSINREKISADIMAMALKDPRSERSRIFRSYRDLLRIRAQQPAFHPSADARVLFLDDRVLALQRESRDQTLFALTNLSANRLTIALPIKRAGSRLYDCLGGGRFSAAAVTMPPYGVRWLVSRPMPGSKAPSSDP